jgi:hypothetical protein
LTLGDFIQCKSLKVVSILNEFAPKIISKIKSSDNHSLYHSISTFLGDWESKVQHIIKENDTITKNTKPQLHPVYLKQKKGVIDFKNLKIEPPIPAKEVYIPIYNNNILVAILKQENSLDINLLWQDELNTRIAITPQKNSKKSPAP